MRPSRLRSRGTPSTGFRHGGRPRQRAAIRPLAAQKPLIRPPRRLERQPEGHHHRHREAQVLVDLDQVLHPAWRQAEQVAQGPAQRQVAQRDAEGKQRDGRTGEQVAPPLFPGVQAGRGERPDLVQPDRRGQDRPDDERDFHPQVERVERAGQDQLADTRRAAAGVPADHGRAQRALDDTPGLAEEDKPGDHPCGQGERHLDDAVAQLTQVIHQRHAALRVPPPLAVHPTLTDDAGTRDGTSKLDHDRSPCRPPRAARSAAGPSGGPRRPLRQASPARRPWRPSSAGHRSAAAARRSAPAGPTARPKRRR